MTEADDNTIRDFHYWIVVARRMVHDNFTADDKELQRLTMEAAKGLMLDHRLAAIERHLAELSSLQRDEDR